MTNLLICGATGFIGRNLLDYFYSKGEYQIRAVHFNRPAIQGYDNVEWVRADLRDPKQVQEVLKGIDIVLQFAATTSGAKDIVSRPYIHVTDNAVMNSLVLRECYEQSIKHFVFPSCTVMYQPSDSALTEQDFDANTPILPVYFGVGNTKVYVEKMCEFFSRLGRTKHTVIRHSNMYGPYDKYDLERSHMFGASITKVMKAVNNEVVIWGTGEESRDLLYVEDLVKFIYLAVTKQTTPYELFAVGVGKAVKVKDVVHKIVQHSGKEIQIRHDLSKPTIPTSLYLDYSKAKQILGWEPETDLDSGIIKTLTWYKQNYE